MGNHLRPRSSSQTLSSVVLSMVICVLFEGCAGALQLASPWSDHTVQIDGVLSEWSDSSAFVRKGDLKLGVMNDDEFLYFCLTSTKAEVGRQVMFRGITVWFDPNGGEKKTFGIRFPIGPERIGMPMRPGRPEREDTRAGSADPQALAELEFLGPTENDRQRIPRLFGQGLEVDLKSTPNGFVYELKIPLVYSSKHPYALETHAGGLIAVGVESNVAERGPGAERAAGPSGTGGRAPGGARGGQMPGRSGATGARSMMGGETMSLWVHVQLAERNR
ncbi:MAG: hypothetical protein FJY85_00135 [Deltaproteobacteria bacterium]|nr:hypothetical protein [Deltaproteobacteria bacterium]